MNSNGMPNVKTDIPGPKSYEVIMEDKHYVTSSYDRAYPIAIDEGKGALVKDIDGNVYIDCMAALGCTYIGHSPDGIIKVVNEQAKKIIHSGGMLLYNKQMSQCAHIIADSAPGDSSKRVIFTTSGAESNEAALKLARYNKKRSGIIYFYGTFHGRTLGTLSVNASGVKPREGFGGLLAGTAPTLYPYCYRCVLNLTYPSCDFACLDFLEDHVLGKVSPAENTAAIIVEPVQSVSGFIWPPEGFLERLKDICVKNELLLIADEVFTGIGKTGKMFASEYWNIEPDLLTTAKSIAGGLPLGVCIARDEVMTWGEGAHSSTFAGNHLSCAASIETFNIIKRENLLEKTVAKGELLMKGLHELEKNHEIIGDIRGKGLFIGVELVKDRHTKEPAKEESAKIRFEALKRGVILLPGGGSSIRLCPSATITNEQIEKVIEILDESLKTYR